MDKALPSICGASARPPHFLLTAESPCHNTHSSCGVGVGQSCEAPIEYSSLIGADGLDVIMTPVAGLISANQRLSHH